MKLVVIIVFCFLASLGSLVADNADIPLELEEVPPGEATPAPEASSMVVPPEASDDSAAVRQAKCHCAVFSTQTPTEADQPIITQSPILVSCDAEGEQNCIKLCSALATAAQESGPQLLCSTLGHYRQLRASVHSRVCDAPDWTYTGLTSPNDICCHQNEVVPCKEDLPNDQSLI